MQSVASKVAGLGRLPSEAAPVRPARRLDVDVVVVGGGVTGIAASARLSARGMKVALVDDGLVLGGALAGAPDRLRALLAASPLADAIVLDRSTAAGDYDGELLVARADGDAVLVRPRATLFATGAHDGVAVFPGNDLPGILSARALCRLVEGGVVPDGPVAIVGDGFWADALVRALGDTKVLRCPIACVVDVRGTGGVRAITVREGDKLESHHVAVVALALPGAPAFELAAQAGAQTRYGPAIGYAVVVGADGRAGPSVWAAGECTGKPFDPDALKAEGERVADAIASTLSSPGSF
jgi:sarcosine oxidase subunit alpha